MKNPIAIGAAICAAALSVMPALAAPKCDSDLARLESADKRTFAVNGYGSGGYFEQTARGRLAYSVQIWRGMENGATRYLTFTEAPGASGPNWGSVDDPKQLKAKISWRNLDSEALGDKLRVHNGPLEGEWTLACQGRPPVKVNFPRFADYPAGQPHRGRIARMKMPRGLHDEVRLRLKDSLSSDNVPEIAGRYIRLTWTCGTACVGGALLDARNGGVIMLPYLSGWGEVDDGFEPVDGRLDSHLVVLSGARNERGLFGRHFYVLNNGRLRHLRSVEVERTFPQKLE